MTPSPTLTSSPTLPLLEVDVQVASAAIDTLPTPEQFQTWIAAALDEAQYTPPHPDTPIDLCIRIVDREEGQELNRTYRNKDYATNVLSFPGELPTDIPEIYLGDLVICAPVVNEEANTQCKSLTSHWAHLTVHGTLHLLGYDHIEDLQAEHMEALETRILDSLGIADPYALLTHEEEAIQTAP